MRSRAPLILLVGVLAACSLSPMVQPDPVQETAQRLLQYHDQRANVELADAALSQALAESGAVRALFNGGGIGRPALKATLTPVLERYRGQLSRDASLDLLDRRSRTLDADILERVAERPADA